jgi:predicted GNAT family N-acyltransferase
LSEDTMFDLLEISPTDKAMLEEIGRLRIRAWATEIPEASTMEKWLDSFDPSSRHWIIKQGDILIASARLSVHESVNQVPDRDSYKGMFRQAPPSPIVSFNRLVVAPSSRGLGLSRRLLIAAQRT